jgi:hypothetical protein
LWAGQRPVEGAGFDEQPYLLPLSRWDSPKLHWALFSASTTSACRATTIPMSRNVVFAGFTVYPQNRH